MDYENRERTRCQEKAVVVTKSTNGRRGSEGTCRASDLVKNMHSRVHAAQLAHVTPHDVGGAVNETQSALRIQVIVDRRNHTLRGE